MHYHGRTGWQISRSIDEALTMVLYVRDVAGLGRYVLTDPDLPPLDPAVPLDLDGVDLRQAIREWERWWSRTLTPWRSRLAPHPPQWQGPEDLPAMRALAQRHADEFRTWRRRVHGPGREYWPRSSFDLTRFVKDYEKRLGRPVRPFTLILREVPLQGAGGWVLHGEQVLMSTALPADADAFRAFLRPVIDALA